MFVAFVLLCTLLQPKGESKRLCYTIKCYSSLSLCYTIATGGAELQRQEEMLPDDGDQLLEQSNSDNPTADMQSANYAEKYDGQVIYIESYRWRGRWLDASKSKGWAYFKSVPEEDVVDHLGLKWLVKNVGGGKVVLESMKYKRRYLDAHHSHWIKVKYSSYPQGQNWARFKIEKSDGRFFFQSDRYQDYRLDAYESWRYKYWAALAKGLGVYAQFRIYVPPKSSEYKLVERFTNQHEYKTHYQLVEKIGVSITNGQEISTTISAEIGGEIKKAFSFGLTYSATWKTFHHTTYSKETTRTVNTKVGPGKILNVLQLVGTYGHYFVRARHFKFETINIRENTREVVFANGIEEYNSGEIEPGPNAGPPGNHPGKLVSYYTKQMMRCVMLVICYMHIRF